MKHFMQPRNAILRENSFETPPLNPSSMKQNRPSSRKQKSCKENAPPSDLNAIPDSSPSPCFTGKPSPSVASKLKSVLPPRPPSSNPLKRKLCTDLHPENAVSGSSDTGVKVIVRMRPPNKNEGDTIVQKTSGDSLSILGQQFTFDSVADATSTQIDIFQLVGAPLVENCLAGFNSSIFAYGQTGSGKTYTIWGPANALVEEHSSSSEPGLTPRVFERLFSRIKEEQNKHADKQLVYQCHCSFLEIYNEQITDLLSPSQRNLHLREDTKTGVYVENLTEETICNMNEVRQLLKKGLSNRKTGATSVNFESSRSHSVFTCVIESRCKSVDGLSCFKTSRMNLVDLAGSERQKSTGTAGERLKEAGNINRSLSQLGNLINILAEVSQTGKQRHIPYRDSKLTFLLQESLGGNAKLAMVCAISPTQSCKNETYSTLRFAQRAKAIKNKAVVNEQMQNDVNTLREVIKQLKDELLRVKSTGNQVDPSAAGYSTGWNARRSLNLLKFSLNYPMNLPRIDDDGDEEMEIVEVSEEVNKKKMETGASGWIERKDSGDGDVNMEEDIYKNHEMNTHGDNQNPLGMPQDLKDASTQNGDGDCVLPNLPIGPSEALKSLTPIVSPIINNSSRKSLRTSLRLTASQKEFTQTTVSSEAFGLSEEENKKKMETGASGWIERKDSGDGDVNMEEDIYKNHEMNTHGDNQNPLGMPQDLKDASTQNGNGDCVIPNLPIEPSEALKSPTPSVSPIINNSSRKSLRTSLRLTASQKELTQTIVSSVAFGGSSFTFSKKPLESKPVSVGVQVLIEGNNNELQAEKPATVLCRNCKCTVSSPDVTDHPNLQMVPVDDGSQLADKSKQLVPKAVEKVLAGAIRREMALEEFCTNQDSEINQLNCLLQQYKHERECNLIIGQIREDKIARLESLMDGILSVEEFKDNELSSLKNENKILKENYENHPEVLRIEVEFKRAREELERYQNFFDLGEKDVLLEEIQDLRSHLQSYLDSSSKKGNPVFQIMYPTDPSVASTLQDSADQSFELKRTQWNEAERKYICDVENLERELQASRLLVEKQKHELETERRCSKELKEAMQMAMEGNARMLEQYADLEEKHIHLLATQRRIEDGIVDVKKAAARAGVKGAESKFINALAAEISTLKVEKEKEIHQYRDEFNGLKAQLKDTDEAVLAAGELLVRLKEAEEAATAAEARAREAEQEKEEACKQIKELKRKQENGALTQVYDMPVYDSVEQESNSPKDQQWKEELVKIYNEDEGELSKLAEPSSWFSGYDACNI